MAITNDELIADIEVPAEEVKEEVTPEQQQEQIDAAYNKAAGLEESEEDLGDFDPETGAPIEKAEEVKEEAPAKEVKAEEAEEETPEESDVEKFTLKVNGEEVEVTLDDLKKGYGTNQAAQQKFQEAAKAKKQAEEFINMLKTDPMAVLNDPNIGLNAREVAEKYLAEQIQIEQMSPEQKELYEAKRTLAAYEEEKKQQEQIEAQRQMEVLTQQYQEEYNNRINKALGDANLPVTEATVQRMAGYLYQQLNSEDPAIQNLKDTDIVDLVREDYVKDFKALFGATDAETLVNILGSDVATKIRQADIAKVTNGAPKVLSKPVKQAHTPQGEKKMTQKEFNAYLDSIS